MLVLRCKEKLQNIELKVELQDRNPLKRLRRYEPVSAKGFRKIGNHLPLKKNIE